MTFWAGLSFGFLLAVVAILLWRTFWWLLRKWLGA